MGTRARCGKAFWTESFDFTLVMVPIAAREGCASQAAASTALLDFMRDRKDLRERNSRPSAWQPRP